MQDWVQKESAAIKAAHALPEWVQKATAITVILEKGYFTNTEVTMPIDDTTTVGTIESDAISRLAELQQERNDFNGPLSMNLVACYGSAKTLYLYSHQSRPWPARFSIKEVMKRHNSDTFALVKKSR